MADEVYGAGELRTTKNPRVGVLRLTSGVQKQYRFSEIDGLGVFEGDIVIARGLELQGVAVVGPGVRWPNKTVVYDADSNLVDTERVTEAIKHWTQNTAIKFKQRTT